MLCAQPCELPGSKKPNVQDSCCLYSFKLLFWSSVSNNEISKECPQSCFVSFFHVLFNLRNTLKGASGISQNNYIFKILDLNNVHCNWKVLLSVRSYNILRHLSHAAVIETSLPFSECLACLSHLLLSYSMQRSTIKWLYCHKGKTEPRVHELWGFLSWEDCDVSLKITAVRNKCCRSVLCSKLILVGICRWNYYSTQSLFVSCEEFQNGGKSPSSSLKVQNILTSSAVSFSDLPKKNRNFKSKPGI